MSAPKLIGYWRNERHDGLPDPAQLVDSTWDPDERDLIAGYLSNGTLAVAMMGLSPCRICGVPNGFAEYTDGVLVWPSGLAHYVQAHNVRLPQTIVEHVLARAAMAEQHGHAAHQQGTRWWVSQVRQGG